MQNQICFIAFLYFSIFSPFVLQAASSYLDEPALEAIALKEATLYSQPGWDWASYKAQSERVNSGKAKASSLPEKEGWLTSNQRVYIIGNEVIVKENKADPQNPIYDSYDKVSYIDSKGNQKIGWLSSDSIRQDLNSLSKTPKTVGEVLGIASDPNETKRKSTETEASACLTGDCFKKPNDNLSNIGEYIDSIGSLKDSEDLEWYLNIYRKNCDDKFHEAYVNDYRQYIQAASKHFGVPESLLTCVLFRESQFDKDVESRTGVKGIAQITGSTVGTIDTIIKSIHISDEQKEKHRKILECGSDVKKWNLACRNVGYIKDQETSRENYNHVRIIEKEFAPLARRWESYFAELETFPDYKKFVKSRYRNYQRPSAFSESLGNKYPPNAIGASALYLKKVLEGIQEHTGNSLSREGAKDALIMAAVGYNAGPGNIWKRTEGEDPSKWISQTINSYKQDQKEARVEYDKAKANYNWMNKNNIPKLQKLLASEGLSEDQIKSDKRMRKLYKEREKYRKRYLSALTKINKADEVENHVDFMNKCMEKGNDEHPPGTNMQCDEYMQGEQ